MSNSETRNNGWAAAWSSLITATSGPLNPGPYFPGHLWSGHMCNSLLGRAGISLPVLLQFSRLTVQVLAPAAASSKCGSTSPWTPSIPINFKQVEPISSSLPTVSEFDIHSIHIIHGSQCFMPCSWGSSGWKDTTGQRMEVNWLCDDDNGLIPAGAW